MMAIAASLLLFAGLACPRSANAADTSTFVNAEVGEITSLDPTLPYDNASQGLLYNVYETLIAYDGPSLSKMVPRLATSVPSRQNGLISPDALVYRFPLRRGVRFQDGSLMTPEDARYSLLRFMLTDEAGGPSALLLEPILGLGSTRDSSGKIAVDFKRASRAVRVEGDTLVITLARPFSPFLSVMARWSYVLPKKWAVEHGAWDGSAASWAKYNNPEPHSGYLDSHADGTGPFSVVRWDRAAKYVLLRRNPGYWRRPARLSQVVIKAVPEFSTRKLLLEAGDADIIEVPWSFVSGLSGISGARVADDLPRLVTDPAFFFTFRINPSANPDIGSGRLDGEGIPPDFFSDPDVRKAFAYSFDYQALIRDVYRGKAQRALGPIPPGVFGFDPQEPHYKYDPVKAEEHFRKAWGGEVWKQGFRFTLTYNVGSENRLAACQILKHGVEAANPRFRVDLRGVEWSSFLDKAQRHLMPVFCRGWYADYPDANNFVFAFYDSAGRYAQAQRYTNPKMDKLIALAAAALSPIKRRSLYRQILRLGYEEEPSIVTVHPTGLYALRRWVRGFYDNPVFLDIYYYPLYKE